MFDEVLIKLGHTVLGHTNSGDFWNTWDSPLVCYKNENKIGQNHYSLQMNHLSIIKKNYMDQGNMSVKVDLFISIWRMEIGCS